jgi:hypothetical protein
VLAAARIGMALEEYAATSRSKVMNLDELRQVERDEAVRQLARDEVAFESAKGEIARQS